MIEVRPIDGGNFRDVLDLEVTPDQSRWVAPTARYLAVCAYGGLWHPLGLYADGSPVGFAMWALDPADGSHWIGGFLVDRRRQGRGHGRAGMLAILEHLRRAEGADRFALSYAPDNAVARELYASLGFSETAEREDGENVARMEPAGD